MLAIEFDFYVSDISAGFKLTMLGSCGSLMCMPDGVIFLTFGRLYICSWLLTISFFLLWLIKGDGGLSVSCRGDIAAGCFTRIL